MINQSLVAPYYNTLQCFFSPCYLDHVLCLALIHAALEDLGSDGDHKLLVGDLGSGQYDMKLKALRGQVKKIITSFCTCKHLPKLFLP